MTKSNKPTTRVNSQTVIADNGNPLVKANVDRAIQTNSHNGLEIDLKNGRFIAKVSDDMMEHALFRLMEGDTMRNVTEELGVSRAALMVKAHSDPVFREMLDTVQKLGLNSLLEDARQGLIGTPGYTTGSVERDKALMDFAKWYATRMDRAKWNIDKQPLLNADRVVIQFGQDDIEGL